MARSSPAQRPTRRACRGSTGVPGAAAENSGPVPEQWNGTWYGVFQVVESNGEFAAVPFGSYDAYLLVKLNQNGEGTFEV